jgi:hypothetical protein
MIVDRSRETCQSCWQSSDQVLPKHFHHALLNRKGAANTKGFDTSLSALRALANRDENST